MTAPASKDSFGARGTLTVGDASYEVFRLSAVDGAERLPYSLKILLENLLRTEDGANITADHVRALAGWDPSAEPDTEIQFTPGRVVMQDFTGVPCVVDLATMREAVTQLGGDPTKVNPLAPAELVIDHSVIADIFGRPDAFELNVDLEYERNRERYQFLRWGQTAFDEFKVVPPGTGIVHQVNIEHLARVVMVRNGQAYPDTLVGTDSHTTMVNGIGVLGWGVGGIEAEAAMLGQPVSMLIPRVVGFKLHGELPAGATATDLVLTITEMLRRHGVVGKFVEFYGSGVGAVPLANRATIGNMSPEFGSTCAIFPIDGETIDYLELTGRSAEQLALVEAYAKEQGLWHDPSVEPVYSESLELDLSTVVPSIAGPKRPQDRIELTAAKSAFRQALGAYVSDDVTGGEERKPGVPQNAQPHGADSPVDEASAESFPASDPPALSDGDQGGAPRVVHTAAEGAEGRPSNPVKVSLDGAEFELDHGAVAIAAITSCTNTSNPSVMIGAALLAKKAVEKGLERKPWVKTTLAPGSKVVMDYYERAGLMPYLEKLGFHLVGYGCTTCIGNSGPLQDEISAGIAHGDLAAVSVLSGNRNFEGRINPDIKMNYLASPPLVVAYALAGSMDKDITTEPLGTDQNGEPVYLADIWPSPQEVSEVVAASISPEGFTKGYADVFAGDQRWQSLPTPTGKTFEWAEDSTYVRKPPYFEGMEMEPAPVTEIGGARVLALLGDSVTTDHISPAGAIKVDSPAGQYLTEHGVERKDFNSYGSRRGNHEVMIRGTFANIRLRNLLLADENNGQGVQGGFTRNFLEEGAPQTTIYDASVAYAEAGVPLVVLAGKEYGSGSSRDWAAKGTSLLGVRAVIAESFERIHRSNLIGMGVLPLQFPNGETASSLGLDGTETFDFTGITALNDGDTPRTVHVTAAKGDGSKVEFDAVVRIDTPGEADYYRNGGIMQYVLRKMVRS
ncbi:aconitate hydratase [Saccharothrix longispora]|nr:aconitate hydratase [Saccharothrix longispora]MDU0290514.1 aconitate hydratase [Saccharothrix longispora]